MNNLPDVVGLGGILRQFPQEFICDNFEATYSNIAERDPDNPLLKVMNDMIYAYFQSMIESINARKYIVGFDILKILMAVVGI